MIQSTPTSRPVRCAIYTRKSTDENLGLAFNSLDAQREAGESFIASRKHEGWTCLAQRYDDGGYSGGSLDRPALRRLLRDIENGQVDCVVVYKVDRLSRSLVQFARILDVFERHSVVFISVTQQFSTADSMGRLTLNMLLSFAQFEREMIADRTRDKIAATRRSGRWTGGRPILGYDVDRSPQGSRLVVNPDEAQRVRRIFELYLERGSLLAVAQELERLEWRTKRYATRKGRDVGGKPFNKCSLHNLLTNPLYVGQVPYHDELHDGEHEAIVDRTLWQEVQTLLRGNNQSGRFHGIESLESSRTQGTFRGQGDFRGRGDLRGRGNFRGRSSELLAGLLRCAHCDCAMSPTHTKRGNRRYRYYVCVAAQRRGWKSCPTKSVPAFEMERFVVDQVRAVVSDPTLLEAAIEEVVARRAQAQAELRKEYAQRQAELRDAANRMRSLLDDGAAMPGSREELGQLRAQMAQAERRMQAIEQEIETLDDAVPDRERVLAVLRDFDAVWEAMDSARRQAMLHLLIDRIVYDGSPESQGVAITYRPTALGVLACQGSNEPAG